MAVKHTSQIICDGCGESAEVVNGGASKARRLARLEGWKDSVTTGTIKSFDYHGYIHQYYPIERGDYCPACHAKGVEMYCSAKNIKQEQP